MEDPNERDRSSRQETESGMTEAEIDQTLADTFPASDPPSWTLGMDHTSAPPTQQQEAADDADAD